jgi:hypothetical protein
MARDEEHLKRQRIRNFVVGGILIALVVLFYLITLVKMSGGAGN